MVWYVFLACKKTEQAIASAVILYTKIGEFVKRYIPLYSFRFFALHSGWRAVKAFVEEHALLLRIASSRYRFLNNEMDAFFFSIGKKP